MKNHRRNNLGASEQGASMMEVLVAVAILAILLGAMTAIFGFATAQMRKTQLNTTHDRLIESLTRIAGMPSALRASAVVKSAVEPFNQYFSNCAAGGDGSMICRHKNANGNYYPFRLYMPVLERPASAIPGYYEFKTSAAITGTPSYPMRYSAAGTPCDTAKQECPANEFPLEAFSEFLPYCPTVHQGYARQIADLELPNPVYVDGANDGYKYLPSCSMAQYIRVKITVRSTVTSSGPMGEFMPYSRTAIVNAWDIYRRTN